MKLIRHKKNPISRVPLSIYICVYGHIIILMPCKLDFIHFIMWIHVLNCYKTNTRIWVQSVNMILTASGPFTIMFIITKVRADKEINTQQKWTRMNKSTLPIIPDDVLLFTWYTKSTERHYWQIINYKNNHQGTTYTQVNITLKYI